MNYLLSALFVLLCITLTKQDGPSATIIAAPVDANDKPVKDIPIEPDHHTTTASPPQPKPTNATTPPPKPTNATTLAPITNGTTTLTPPTNGTTTLTPPSTNGTTTLAPPPPPTNGTTTMAPPTNKTTVVPNPTKAPNVTTEAPATTVKPEPEHHRRFDGPSFVGGIVLALGLAAIGFVAFKFYKARIEVNYHTL